MCSGRLVVGRRDDRARRQVREQLERDRRAVDDLAPAPAIGALTDPRGARSRPCRTEGDAPPAASSQTAPGLPTESTNEARSPRPSVSSATARFPVRLELDRRRSQLAHRVGGEERRQLPIDRQPVRRARVVERGPARQRGSAWSRARPRCGARSRNRCRSSGMKSVISPTPPSVKKRVTSTAVPGQVELLRRERLPDGLEREAAAGVGVEDRAEQAGRVEALGAEPVDRALVADERDRVQVADDAVVLDREVAAGAALAARAGAPAPRAPSTRPRRRRAGR